MITADQFSERFDGGIVSPTSHAVVNLLAQELERARRARNEAEEACCAVEELLWEVGRGPRSWRRLAQVDAAEPEPLALPH